MNDCQLLHSDCVNVASATRNLLKPELEMPVLDLWRQLIFLLLKLCVDLLDLATLLAQVKSRKAQAAAIAEISSRVLPFALSTFEQAAKEEIEPFAVHSLPWVKIPYPQ